jgi:hypothetical protein
MLVNELALLAGGDEYELARYEIRRQTNAARKRLGLPERHYPDSQEVE